MGLALFSIAFLGGLLGLWIEILVAIDRWGDDDYDDIDDK